MNHFDAAYLAMAPFFLASAYYKRLRKGKYRRSLPGMFGANLPEKPLPAVHERVWMHSVSVGETIAAGALFRVLREKYPQWEYLSTTTTETGQDQAKRSLRDADYYDFAPVDLSWKVRNFLHAYRPTMYLFFETEIWPNMLLESGRAGLPVFLVNGKLSERSARRYAMARAVLRKPLSQVGAFLMQTRADADRLRMIVSKNASIHVTGNVKFDNLPEALDEKVRTNLRRLYGADGGQLLFLAGSTHPTEERLIYRAFMSYQKHGGPAARLAIAPRHPERFNEVAAELERLGARIHRTSSGVPPSTRESVLLMDEMGVLARNFGAADIALVGGAWNPIGGHNLLEPAAHGVPVLHGPHMHAQKEIMRIMKARKASRSVPGDLIDEALLRLAQSESARKELGQEGKRAAEANKGAAHRSVEILEECLTSSRN